MTDRLFRYAPPVSIGTVRAWQRELDRVFVPEGGISRLVLRWEGGDVWQPIQRWIIWQCEDPNEIAVPPMVRPSFRGPHPRSLGHYCAPGYCFCDLKANCWRGGAPTVFDRATWELWRDTGLYGRRWWTIQGNKGGHRFTWAPDELESKVSQMMGGPIQTPDPGDLPYAPFDTRVTDKIGRLDKVRDWKLSLDFAARNVEQLEQAQYEEARKAKEKLWDWIDWGIDEAWDEGGKAFRRTLNDMGRAPLDTRVDTNEEVIHERFLAVE